MAEALATPLVHGHTAKSLAAILADLERRYACRLWIDPQTKARRGIPDGAFLSQVRLRHALEYLLDQNDLAGVIEGDTLWVSNAD
jgi:hypothetical protein